MYHLMQYLHLCLVSTPFIWILCMILRRTVISIYSSNPLVCTMDAQYVL